MNNQESKSKPADSEQRSGKGLSVQRLVRPLGFPPQVWEALREIQMAQSRLEEDYPRFNEAGQKYAVECAAANLRHAHAKIMHFADEVERAVMA